MAGAAAGCKSPVKTVSPTLQVPPNDVMIQQGNCLAIAPQSIDFGNVVVASTASGSVALTNNCGVAVSATLGTLGGGDALLFGMDPAGGSVIELDVGKTTSVTVQYQPLVPSKFQSQATFAISYCNADTGCNLAVSLQGTAVATGLSAAPSSLSYGFVPKNQGVTQVVTLTSIANTTVHLTADPAVLNVTTSGTSSDGPFQSGAGVPISGAAIAPGQSLQIPVTFTPTYNDLFTGELDVSTDDVSNSNLKFALQGFGGGAVISCTPGALDFGRNEVGIPANLQIVCTNAGTDVPGHPEANLLIPDPNSGDPAFSIQNGSAAFQAGFDSTFPAAGLAAGKSTRIDVTYDPTLAGTDSDGLIIASNDSVTPKTTLALAGVALALPACEFQINPTNGLSFGHVNNGAVAILPFEIVNSGTSDCLVNHLQLTEGTDPAFSLPDFPPGTKLDQIVPAGQALTIDVQFAPTTATGNAYVFGGAATFTLSDPSNAQQTVSLHGSALTGCLVIQPDAIDFGVFGYDPTTSAYCGSGQRTVTVFNICETQDVNVKSIQVVDLAAMPQFVLSADPSPVVIPPVCGFYYCGPYTPVTFQVSFAPTAVGVDRAGLMIVTDDLYDPYLVTLTGAAQQSPNQTDSFTARAAQLDLLLVIDTDDSDSDAASEQSMIGDLTNFLTYPSQNGIDLHIATTSTDVYAHSDSEDGRMEPCPGCKADGQAMQVVTLAGGVQAAVTSLTPLINLGANSFCYSNCNGFAADEMLLEATYEALSPALLSGYNQAFYRPDASLAVVVVIGDSEDDQSDNHTLNFFYNAFVSLKGVQNASKFSLSRLSNYGGIRNNQKMSMMAQVTGGVEADLADTGTPSWTDELNGLWPIVGAQLLDYPLSGTPVSNSIVVTDNGVVIPALAPAGTPNWTYDATANAVRFDPSVFPPAGDAIQISYALSCSN
jgi:hypothetical protein